jgi:aspartyl protease family protein
MYKRRISQFIKQLFILVFVVTVSLHTAFSQNDIQKGFDLMKAKKYRDAYDKFTEAIKKHPDSARAYRGRGQIDYILLKDTVGALSDFNKAIKLKPDLGLAYRNRGDVYMWLKDYTLALLDFNKCIELLPDFDKAYNDRGYCKLFLKDYVGSVQDFNKVIALNPTDAASYMGRGRAEKNMNLFDIAMEDLNKGLQLDSTLKKTYDNVVSSSPELLKLRGVCSLRMVKKNGVYYIQTVINGVPTEFIFDTGAASICISATEAAYLREKGVLTDEDNRGNGLFTDATGKATRAQLVNIKSVKIGCYELKNVIASITPTLNAPFLMGETALSKLGKISIDYKNLIISFQ